MDGLGRKFYFANCPYFKRLKVVRVIAMVTFLKFNLTLRIERITREKFSTWPMLDIDICQVLSYL